MRSPVLLSLFLSALFTLGLVHFLASDFSLYWKYPWLDIPMHALGGVTSALGVFLIPLFNVRIPARYFTFVPILVYTLIIGLLWEIFEIQIGFLLFEDAYSYALDTLKDLVMDLVGGTIGYALVQSIRRF